MTKVSLLGRNSKTIPTQRYALKSSKELNEFRFPLFLLKHHRINNIERDLDDTMRHHTNNYRKIMNTYFEPYD
jgi:hypothetical protein